MESTTEQFKKPEKIAKKIDCHVHLVGTGSNHLGCWINARGHRKAFAQYMIHEVKLPWNSLWDNFDAQYTLRLLEMIRESSLDQVVLLANDYTYSDDGKQLKNFGAFYVPNQVVLDLSARYQEFIPAVSIHPARVDALEELEHCIEQGAMVMKCLPNCHNIDCNKKSYTKFWQRMADAGIVLLAHTGGEIALPVAKKEFSDPRVLHLPLECGVKVIAAHCATSSGLFDPDYSEVLAQMLQKFPNLYADNSALNTPFRSKHLKFILRDDVKDRIIHGSDMPIPVSAYWAYLRKFIKREQYRSIQKFNPLERDYQIKKAIGVPENSFTLLSQLLRSSNSNELN